MMNICIIGTGNIGTDLLYKVQKNNNMNCVLFVGKRENSKGIEIAKKLGVRTSIGSIQDVINFREEIDLVFDATSADSHRINEKYLSEYNIPVIDLTPAKIGKMCVPVINAFQCKKERNINMITCGGQAMIPIAYAISRACNIGDISYLEIVASISSKSAGKGTRENIDEFTQTTKDALAEFTKVENTKAIIILNPAIPEHNMRNTLYCYMSNPNKEMIKNNVLEMVDRIRKYVPGYRLLLEPVFEKDRVVVTVEVEGAGDYLPKYSGNLDIITSAAIQMAKIYFSEEVV